MGSQRIRTRSSAQSGGCDFSAVVFAWCVAFSPPLLKAQVANLPVSCTASILSIALIFSCTHSWTPAMRATYTSLIRSFRDASIWIIDQHISSCTAARLPSVMTSRFRLRESTHLACVGPPFYHARSKAKKNTYFASNINELMVHSPLVGVLV